MTADDHRRVLWTVGHGRTTPERFTALLARHGIAAVVDVRRHPVSRRNPQHARRELERWLPDGGVAYRWAPDLGGRREPAPASPHTAIADPALRGYADHMATPAFRAALRDLLDADAPTAVLCAEGEWRRCHRRFIADAVVLMRLGEVRHLRHDGGVERHTVARSARLAGGAVVYDRGQLPLGGTR
ncbi:MAG TPA: DUF488 domain-containing protein [Euzebyales bacterium]|nr:DUF488 domain-containing protein [Euzebyales bacterium]